MPMFKKSGGKIFGVQFNKAEERALDQEIKKQIVENDRAFDMDKESSILWMLHTQFGFGPKRLKLAWKLFYAETLKLREYYLMDQEDDGWLVRKKLKDIGCDIFELHGKGLLAFAKANSDFLNNRENQSATGSKQSKESVE